MITEIQNQTISGLLPITYRLYEVYLQKSYFKNSEGLTEQIDIIIFNEMLWFQNYLEDHKDSHNKSNPPHKYMLP